MTDLYRRDNVNQLISKLKKAIRVSVILLIVAIIVFVLFLVFTTRQNKYFHGIANAIITSAILCYDFGYLKLVILPINDEIKFVKKLIPSKDDVVNVKKLEITEERIFKNKKNFVICKINDFEYLIEEDKLEQLNKPIKSIKVNGRFIVMVKENKDE